MALFLSLPLELKQQVFQRLNLADLGNCAMTCTHTQLILEPTLTNRLKRLILADSNILRLIEPESPEAYGLVAEDGLNTGDGGVEAPAIRHKLRCLVEALGLCPILAKFVKHVFIDYRMLSDGNHGSHDFDFDQNRHRVRLVRYLKLGFHPNSARGLEYWTSTCGLAAMILLLLPNVESLALVGVGSRTSKDSQDYGEVLSDPIMDIATFALAPDGQQIRLCRLKNIYATGCDEAPHEPCKAPWELLILPSIQNLEVQQVTDPLPFGTAPDDYEFDDCFGRFAPNWDGICYLTSLSIRHSGLPMNGLNHMFAHMPFLKRLSYQCFPAGTVPYIYGRGIQVERLGIAIQTLRECLEELTIKVESVRDLWGFFSFHDHDDLDFIPTDSEGSDESSDDEFDDSSDTLITTEEVVSLTNAEDPNVPYSTTYESGQDAPSIWKTRGAQDTAERIIQDRHGLHLHSQDYAPEPSWDDRHPEFLGSLASFKKLKYITVPAIALQDPWPYPAYGLDRTLAGEDPPTSKRQDLKDILPRSIERLTLSRLDVDSSDLGRDIEEITNAKEANFPNLVSLELDDTPSCLMSEKERHLWDYTPWHIHRGHD